MVIILILVNFYGTSPINCQVGVVFHIYFFYAHWLATIPRHGSLPVGWASNLYERAFVPDILPLGIFRTGWLWPKFDIDHASHVSFYVSVGHDFHGTTLFPKYVLMELSSFAIWDKSKIIMAISSAIWVINLGFQLAGKLTSSIPCESQRIWFDIRYR